MHVFYVKDSQLRVVGSSACATAEGPAGSRNLALRASVAVRIALIVVSVVSVWYVLLEPHSGVL